MVALKVLVSNPQKSDQVIRNNWNGLYPRDNQFTYPEATLVLPKKSKKQR